MNEKVRAARLSIASNTILTAGKLAVGISINSVSVISEAIHSGLDLMAALIAFFSVREASKPADDRHHYGHGKFENLAGITEALLILGAAVMIIMNAYPKIIHGTEIHSLGLGAAIMGVSVVVNFFVSRELMRVARKTESPALAADAWHLRTDVYTSLGVFAGIIAIKLTGMTALDPLIAIGVALLIIKAAFDLIRDSMCSILDAGLPQEEERLIREVLKKHEQQYVEFHDLRTRKAGSERYIDLHLVVPRVWAIHKVHSLCDRIEDEICRKLNGVNVLIHTEPCGKNCEECDHANKKDGSNTKCKDTCEECTQCKQEP